MNLNFQNKTYFQTAMAGPGAVQEPEHTAADAFALLIRGASQGQLGNLCALLCRREPEVTLAHAYARTQGEQAGTLLPLALECLDQGMALGEEKVPGTSFNASDYMGHCLLEGRLCAELAGACGMDRDYAFRLGILHDYGRRETHTLAHTVRGFELLTDLGWKREAFGCLTHSFLNGGRCASNETAEPGFYVDEQGMPCWREDAERDEMTQFLEQYTYSDYDRILNIADLMATSHGVASPMERLRDIATRRTLDPTNRGYFLAELTDQLLWLMGCIGMEIPAAWAHVHRAEAGIPLERLQQELEAVSAAFYEAVGKLTTTKAGGKQQ